MTMLSFKSFFLIEQNLPSRSKSEEASRAKLSPLQSGTHRGYSVEVGVHSPSQQLDRNGQMSKGNWDDFKGRMAAALKDKEHGHYIIHSKKYNQAIVVQHIPEEKRIKVETTLPKGKYSPRDSKTQYHMIESVEGEFNLKDTIVIE